MEVLSAEAKDAAANIERRLQLGSKLSEIVTNREDAHALFDLYKDEGYILAEYGGKFCVSEICNSLFFPSSLCLKIILFLFLALSLVILLIMVYGYLLLPLI